MRIVVVGVYAKSLLTFRGELLRAMAANGHEVLALAPQDDQDVRAALQAMGVRFEVVPLNRSGMNPVQDVSTVWFLIKLFRSFRADSVLVYAAKPVVYGLIAARLAGVPLRAAMITGTGSILGGGTGLQRRALATVLRTLYRAALRYAHVVFFQNPDDERSFRSSRLVRTNQRVVRINGSGVDLVRYAVAPLPGSPTTFVMVSRLIRDKGVFEYVEAARRVRQRRPDAVFQLLGPMDTNVSALTPVELETLRQDGDIEYLGTLDDVRPVIAAAHVCVLPSYGEGTPRSVLEAMAMGRAIITTDVPGCRETVEDGRNGRLVPVRDGPALAVAMLGLVDVPEQIKSMGRESRRIAEERFDVHDVNRTILQAMGLQRPTP